MKKEISIKNLPTRLPVGLTALMWLMLDRFGASDLAFGIVGTLIVLAWICAIYRMCNREVVDLFDNNKSK